MSAGRRYPSTGLHDTVLSQAQAARTRTVQTPFLQPCAQGMIAVRESVGFLAEPRENLGNGLAQVPKPGDDRLQRCHQVGNRAGRSGDFGELLQWLGDM